MRISDWSSDVCSSDLFELQTRAPPFGLIKASDILVSADDIAREDIFGTRDRCVCRSGYVHYKKTMPLGRERLVPFPSGLRHEIEKGGKSKRQRCRTEQRQEPTQVAPWTDIRFVLKHSTAPRH